MGCSKGDTEDGQTRMVLLGLPLAANGNHPLLPEPTGNPTDAVAPCLCRLVIAPPMGRDSDRDVITSSLPAGSTPTAPQMHTCLNCRDCRRCPQPCQSDTRLQVALRSLCRPRSPCQVLAAYKGSVDLLMRSVSLI